ncbi:serine hydrolase [Simkania sp.]|uniref:serine hydrolase n=1 Tax=Simkania sp. TaxID=34094 RepID=UPI003B52DDAE
MKRTILLAALLLFCLTSSSYSREAINLKQIDALAKEARETFQIPGLAVGVVVDDKLVFAKGYGYRNVEEKLPVTHETVFMIGSMTKSFTTFALATLVEQGKISWDDKVISYLPDFRLKDSYTTQEMTIRDLVTHVSGLPRHDLVWYLGENSTEDLYNKLQFLEPVSGFRSKFNYQNLMYMVAGKVIEKVTGKPWNKWVLAKIMTPLKMTHSSFSVAELQYLSNVALPYVLKDEEPLQVPYREISHIGPAGSINSNLIDLTSWMKMLLNFGQFEETTVLGAPHVKQLMSPQTVAHIFLSQFPESNHEFLETYGLGWFIQSFQGHYLVAHGGSIDGFQSNLALLPLDKIGVVVLTNKGGGIEATLLTKAILGTLLGYGDGDYLSSDLFTNKGSNEEDSFPTKEGTSPSHPLEHYAGVYEHPAYGQVEIVYDEGLKMQYHGLTIPLEHLHFDVFHGEAKSDILPLKLTLSFDTDWYGNVKQVILPLPTEGFDLQFVKKPHQNLFDLEYLKIFEGKYKLANVTVRLFIEDTTLKAEVPGQPLYELVPQDKKTFTLKGFDNIHFEFIMKNDTEVEVLKIVQPQGVFKATPCS